MNVDPQGRVCFVSMPSEVVVSISFCLLTAHSHLRRTSGLHLVHKHRLKPLLRFLFFSYR